MGVTPAGGKAHPNVGLRKKSPPEATVQFSSPVAGPPHSSESRRRGAPTLDEDLLLVDLIQDAS
jgi:hypothetical protein